MMSVARAILIFVGVVSIILGVMGCWYNLTTIGADFTQLQQQFEVPYFYPAFYTMSAICVACFLALIYIGVQMVRGRTEVTRLLMLVMLFEILYFVAVGVLWAMPEYGMSIGAATGVANGGLMIQAFTLFPLWAPLTAYFASRSLKRAELQSTAAGNPGVPSVSRQ